MCSGRSATSSRKSVPPLAAWNRPSLSATAPVKLPFLWPKNSLSMSSLGMAPQLTGMKGLSARGPLSWMRRATSSLPTPDSPLMYTRRLAARELRDCGLYLFYRRGFAEQRESHATRGSRLGLRQFQRGVHEIAQHLQIDRLGDEVEGAGLERADRGLHAAVGGDHGHRRIGIILLNMLHELDAVAVGQAHIGEAEVEMRLRQTLARGGDRIGRGGVDAHAAEKKHKQNTENKHDNHHQGGRLGAHVSCFLLGSAKVMRKQLPPPGMAM